MYPAIEPRKTGHLNVGDGHNLYYELSGNPDGIPAVYLHGGPGGGSHPDMRRLFDPSRYNIILYDQRGCGKSTPFGSLNNNTIESLTDDVDKLRRHLNIDKWVVTGGSWGSTLALLHTLKSQQAVSALVVSGTFYADKKGAQWLAEEGGASEMM